MVRRWLLALAACMLPRLAGAAAAQAPYNVVLVDVCSARADRFGLYGYSRDTTPNLDALARESVVFDHALAQSSWCLPNYASLFTGHTPEVHGQHSNVPARGLPEFETTLAERLKEAGYDTAAFSGGVYLMKAWGLHKGFDAYENVFSTERGAPGPAATTLPIAYRWLEGGRERPFFLYLAVDDLHAPYQSDEPERYDPGYEGVAHASDVAHVAFFRAYNGEPLKEGDPLRLRLAEFRRDPRHLAHLAAHYDASLRSVDRRIAELIARLKGAGQWERTVLIVTADHGELLGEHGLLGHTEGLYEPVLRVPLIVRHPGLAGSAGRRVSSPVQRIDLTPTILEVAGAAYGANELQGSSLMPLLRDHAAPWRRYAYASSKRNLAEGEGDAIDERVLQDERWKLHWYLHKDRYELYDILGDPLEEDDLSAKRQEVVSRMAFELLNRVEVSRPHAPGPSFGPLPAASPRLERPPRDADLR